MAEPANPPANPPAPGDPPADDAQKTKFKEWFGEAMSEWAEKNKPAPQRTSSGFSFGDVFPFLFGK